MNLHIILAYGKTTVNYLCVLKIIFLEYNKLEGLKEHSKYLVYFFISVCISSAFKKEKEGRTGEKVKLNNG